MLEQHCLTQYYAEVARRVVFTQPRWGSGHCDRQGDEKSIRKTRSPGFDFLAKSKNHHVPQRAER